MNDVSKRLGQVIYGLSIVAGILFGGGMALWAIGKWGRGDELAMGIIILFGAPLLGWCIRYVMSGTTSISPFR